MRPFFLFLALIFLASSCHNSGQGKVHSTTTNPSLQKVDTSVTTINFSKLKIAELPRPNSETYSFEEAGKRKKEIYNLQPTQKYFDWKNPTSGGAIHINKKDEIEVYQFTSGIYLYSNENGAFHMSAPKDTFIVVKNTKELLLHVGGIGFGKPASVLITSELSLSNSESIKKVLEELWTPSVQIYFITKR